MDPLGAMSKSLNWAFDRIEDRREPPAPDPQSWDEQDDRTRREFMEREAREYLRWLLDPRRENALGDRECLWLIEGNLSLGQFEEHCRECWEAGRD